MSESQNDAAESAAFEENAHQRLLTGWAGHDGHELVRSIAGVGFLGGFTTFSTASVELVRLTRAERPLAAGGLAVAMIMLSLTMCLLGLTLGQLVG